MKRTIIALSTALTVGSALAASNTTLSTSTSSTNLGTNTFKDILKDISVSYFGILSKGEVNSSNSQSRSINELTATYKVNDSVSTYARIRYGLGDGVKNKEGKNAGYRKFLNPRFGVRAFNYENGKYSISPELRVELPLAENKDNTYGVIRLSQSSVYKFTSSFSAGIWASISETVTSDKTPKDKQDVSNVAIIPSVSYEINDAHSFSLTYETTTSIKNQDLKYDNKLSDNTYYLDYNNSQIKNVTLTPGLTMNAAKMNIENIGVQLQIRASI